VGLIWRGKRKEHSGTFARRAKEERCEFLLTRGSSSKKDNPSVTAAPCQLPLHKGAFKSSSNPCAL